MSRETIRARVKAATPGPWEWHDAYALGQPGEDGMVVTLIDRFETKPNAADRDLIAHAREDIPALLAVADAAAKHRAKMRFTHSCPVCETLDALEAKP